MVAMRILVAIGLLLASAGPAGAMYSEIKVENGGAVSGEVRVQGEAPALPPLPVYKFHEVCGATVPDERLVVGQDGALANVVVYLQGVEFGKPIPRDQPVQLDNKKCAFVPHVVSASLGQTLEIHNSDPILHDAHARLGPRTVFNRAIMHGKTVRELLQDVGLIQINCNVRHSWMQAWVYVAENPYHAVTDREGHYRIDGIPAGKYTLTVWQEMLGGRDIPIEIKPGAETRADVQLSVTAPPEPQ
jgi:plastocyanin